MPPLVTYAVRDNFLSFILLLSARALISLSDSSFDDVWSWPVGSLTASQPVISALLVELVISSIH